MDYMKNDIKKIDKQMKKKKLPLFTLTPILTDPGICFFNIKIFQFFRTLLSI